MKRWRVSFEFNTNDLPGEEGLTNHIREVLIKETFLDLSPETLEFFSCKELLPRRAIDLAGLTVRTEKGNMDIAVLTEKELYAQFRDTDYEELIRWMSTLTGVIRDMAPR